MFPNTVATEEEGKHEDCSLDLIVAGCKPALPEYRRDTGQSVGIGTTQSVITMKIARRAPSFPRRRESIFAAHTLDAGLRRNDDREAGRATFIPLCGLGKAMVIPAKAGIHLQRAV